MIKKILEVGSVKCEEAEALLKFKRLEIWFVQTEFYVAIHSLKQILQMILQELLSIGVKTLKVIQLILDWCLF